MNPKKPLHQPPQRLLGFQLMDFEEAEQTAIDLQKAMGVTPKKAMKGMAKAFSYKTKRQGRKHAGNIHKD